MKVRDEYKCRRCGKVFSIGETPIEPPMIKDVIDTIGEGIMHPWPHECEFGGVGVADWVGISEVKEDGKDGQAPAQGT